MFLFISLPLSGTKADRNDPAFVEYLQVVMERAPRGVSPSQVVQHTSAYDLFVFKNGFKPARPGVSDLFFSLFLHAGWLHLIGNMLFLWIYGDNVEHRLGSFAYLIAYLGTGVAATLGHMLISPGSGIPTIGASGAISGMLGFYFVWFPKNQVRVLVFLFPFIFNVFLLPARWVLGFYLIVDNLFPFLFGSRGASVAYGAHIGGFVAGAVVAYLYGAAGASVKMRRKIKRRRPPRPVAVEPGIGIGPSPAVAGGPRDGGAVSPPVRTLNLAEQGRYDEAVEMFSRADAQGDIDEIDALAFGDLLARRGEVDTALGVFLGFIRHHPESEHVAQALLMTGLLYLHGKKMPAYAYNYLSAALDRRPEGPVGEQAQKAMKEIEAMQKFKFRGK